MKSWKTTTVGILTGVIMLSTQVIAALDNNPETIFNLDAVILALGIMGIGTVARDNDKSSEDVGINN